VRDHTNDGRWASANGDWNGSWLVVSRPGPGTATTFQGGVNAGSAVVRLPGSTLVLNGPVRTELSPDRGYASGIDRALSYQDWYGAFLSDQLPTCHLLPINPPNQRLHLTAPVEEAGCYRDPFNAGISYEHGVSVAGPSSPRPWPPTTVFDPTSPLKHLSAAPFFVFGDHGIVIDGLSYGGIAALEAPDGRIDLPSITGPRELDRAWLDLGAGSRVTIG
jgi:hypothetical protein